MKKNDALLRKSGCVSYRYSPPVRMPPKRPPTRTDWDHQYNTLRRQDLFRNPPTDHTAYPLLQAAINPHTEGFNALFKDDEVDGGRPASLMAHALLDIGSKSYLDGKEDMPIEQRNRLSIRIKSISLQKSFVPPTNKFARKREIYPAECRERHCSYRGRLSALMEYRINNGDGVEFSRDLGYLPIMVKVGDQVFNAPGGGHR
jgi:DNA-directed RNA polymerase I subunit RPA2